jgi:hypothetical protein
MPAEWKDLPLIAPPYESVEDMEVDQWAATIIDAVPIVVEGKLHLMKRFGLTPWITLGTSAPIDGLYWADRLRAVLVVSNGRVWKITDSAGTLTELTGSIALRTSSPVTFAGDGTRVVMANGGQMVHTDFSTLTTMADAQAPTEVTHVAHLDGYILANEVGTGRGRFSAINDLTDWVDLDFFSAESDPDDLMAMKVAYREIIAVGRESVEFWVNDGQTPFQRIQGSAQPFGIEAPHSLNLAGPNWMWLGHNRRMVTMEGRQVKIVSTPYDRVIQRYTAVDDAVGYSISMDGLPLYVLNFPTARETLVFNHESQQWHKWGYWDSSRGLYERYRGLSYCYARAWNFHLVGDYANGIIYKADRQTFTDNGNPIRSLLRTGHISHGAEFTKRSDVVRLRCKRGQGNSAVADPQVMMRRRINNGAQWTNERWKSLGRVGQHSPYIDWRRNGIYRTCQYEFTHTDNSDFIVTGAQELLTVLGK